MAAIFLVLMLGQQASDYGLIIVFGLSIYCFLLDRSKNERSESKNFHPVTERLELQATTSTLKFFMQFAHILLSIFLNLSIFSY